MSVVTMRRCPNDEGADSCEGWIWMREHRCDECRRWRGNRLARERRMAARREPMSRERDPFGRLVFGVLIDEGHHPTVDLVFDNPLKNHVALPAEIEDLPVIERWFTVVGETNLRL